MANVELQSLPAVDRCHLGDAFHEDNNSNNDEDTSPIEQVRLTVSNTDDSSLPVWTFRMWLLGVLSCVLLSFLNQFFSYRKEPMVITVLVATQPIGRFLAAALPTAQFGIPGFGDRRFSLNPGPFNMKEHVLISIFANAGSAFGNGSAYAVGIVNIIKAFYHRNITFVAAWILIVTTQVLGYGWAGLLRKYVVEPAHMWWPNTLAQVSLFRFRGQGLHLHSRTSVITRSERPFLPTSTPPSLTSLGLSSPRPPSACSNLPTEFGWFWGRTGCHFNGSRSDKCAIADCDSGEVA